MMPGPRLICVLLGFAVCAPCAIRLEPSTIHLSGPGASQRFVISVTDKTGFELDATATCLVRSEHPQIAVVKGTAFLAIAPGSARGTVRCGNESLNFTLRVAA